MHVGRVEGLRGTLWRRTETRAFPAQLFKALRMSEPRWSFTWTPERGPPPCSHTTAFGEQPAFLCPAWRSGLLCAY